MEASEITRYINMALRRKYWIIIPFLLTLLAGLAYALVAPKVYEAETLILVQAQKVPEDFVRPIMTTEMEDRLATITQQVTSRTNLEQIIDRYSLYGSEGNAPLEARVEAFRKAIDIEVSSRRGRGSNSFTIKYQGKDPEKVKAVTNALASNFISENLRMRESQALGTSTFLADELESVEVRLKEKEAQLKEYREKYMGGLPEQLETNLSILERLEGRLEQLNTNLRDAESRKMAIQERIAEAREASTRTVASETAEEGEATDLESLKNQLASLESRYTDRHPDVIRLRKTIEKLEARVPAKTGTSFAPGASVNPELAQDLEDVSLETRSLRAEIRDVKSQVKWYQKKVEETPKREQELLSLRRDYENLKDLYDSLLDRKLEAEMAVSMERKQKGEQFRVIDPAKKPELPVKPDLRKALLITLVLGLGLGGGLAYVKETMDTSYKTPEELEKELDLPVLAGLPMRYTEKELRSLKRRRILANASIVLGFVFSAVGIVLAAKGVDKTLNYFQEILGKI